MTLSLSAICAKFGIKAEEKDVQPYGSGHINTTYLVSRGEGYILQKINVKVFREVDKVMENIANLTDYMREQITDAGGNPDRETLTLIRTVDGDICYKVDDETYYRMYKFITDSLSYDFVENPKQLYYTGKAFGKFQQNLNGFSIDSFHETIKDFHNTPVRYKQLEEAIKNNASGRKDSVQEEIDFAAKYKKYTAVITDAIKAGEIPLRVTHNDTKLNNVLFDKDSGEGVCVIDLDTIMPGSMLYDFGDSLRFGASSGTEDEKDLSKIWFDLEKFEYYAKGFLEEVKDIITEKEKELLPLSALLMTYECGIRFLADYINGDTYFRTHYPEHNLDRAHTQLKLVYDIETKLPKMSEIIDKILKEI